MERQSSRCHFSLKPGLASGDLQACVDTAMEMMGLGVLLTAISEIIFVKCHTCRQRAGKAGGR